MAEVLFSAALVAGVVEGAEVLNHECYRSIGSTDSVRIIPSSFIYGSIAVPLSVVGASPGPNLTAPLVAWAFPNTLPNSDEGSSTPHSSSYADNGPMRRVVGHNGISSTQDHMRAMVSQTREAKRRTMAAMSAAPPQTIGPSGYLATLDGKPLPTTLAEAMRRSRIFFVGAGTVVALFTYKSKLSLQTKERETQQKRNRLAGRDAHSLAYYLSSNVDSPKFAGAAVRLIGNGSNGLLESSSLAKSVYTDSRNKPETPIQVQTLPLLCSSNGMDELTESIFSKQTTEEGSLWAYWNLGQSPEEWSQMPISSDWLFKGDKHANDKDPESNLLLLEAVVTPPLRYCIRARYGSTSGVGAREEPVSRHLSRERARIVSQTLEWMAIEKGLLNSRSADVETSSTSDETSATNTQEGGIVRVLIDSRPNTSPAHSSSGWSLTTGASNEEIIVDSLASVARSVFTFAEACHTNKMEAKIKAYSKVESLTSRETDAPLLAGSPTTTKQSGEEKQHEDNTSIDFQSLDENDSEPESSNFRLVGIFNPVLNAIDGIGKRIRKMATTSLEVIGRSHIEKRVLHVVSDERGTAEWLFDSMRRAGWTILWHDTSAGQNDWCHQLEPDSIVIVSCSTDDKTCNSACHLVSSRPDLVFDNVTFLFENNSSQDTFHLLMKQLLGEQDESPALKSMTVSNIHNQIFQCSRELLASNKSVHETQSSLDSQLIISS